MAIIYYKRGDGLTTICFRGWDTSPPPACLTNSAGERKLPWHTHTILTCSPFRYLYRKPSTRFPLGPNPLVDTQGISTNMFLMISVASASLTASFTEGLSIAAPTKSADFTVGVASCFCSFCLGREWTLAGLLASVYPFIPAIETQKHDNMQSKQMV